MEKETVTTVTTTKHVAPSKKKKSKTRVVEKKVVTKKTLSKKPAHKKAKKKVARRKKVAKRKVVGKSKKVAHPSHTTIIQRESPYSETLVSNFVALQKIMTNLSGKLDDLANKMTRLLDIFEISAKALAEKDFNLGGGDKKLDNLLEQNKVLARGLTLVHDRMAAESIAQAPAPAPTPMPPRTEVNPPISGWREAVSPEVPETVMPPAPRPMMQQTMPPQRFGQPQMVVQKPMPPTFAPPQGVPGYEKSTPIPSEDQSITPKQALER